MTPEVLADIRNLLYAGYRSERVTMTGADGPADYLRTKGHKYLPDAIVKRVDDEVRKQLEAEGLYPLNPLQRNGWTRTIDASPEEVFDSLLTRQKTTATRRARDRRQARNLRPVLTDKVAQAVIDAQSKIDEAEEKARAAKDEALAGLWRQVYDASKTT